MRSPAQWCVGLVTLVGAAALTIAAGSSFTAPIVAQSALAQLGLTEASAREFVFRYFKSNPVANRRADIAVRGHRAFYKLPPAARGPAATALFAWAKAYVNSPVFKTAYAQYRKDAMPLADERPGPSAEAEAAELKTNQEMVRQIVEKMPPAEREKFLAQMKEQEKQMAETRARIQKVVEAGEAERKAQDKAQAIEFEARFPADPNQRVARQLRGFLSDTADVDFTAPIIRLTDGPDGMEFIAPAHRAKSVTWQLAVLAGPEATKAARAAAEAWLKEVAP